MESATYTTQVIEVAPLYPHFQLFNSQESSPFL